MKKDFELVPHTADMKLRVYGDTLAELFRHAVIGMFQSIGPHAKGCTTERGRLVCPTLSTAHDVEVSSADLDSLLVDFLSYALYLSDVHNEAYLDATIYTITPTHVRATVRGVQVTRFDVVEIKAVTYNDLDVHQSDGHWQADVVFDI